MLATSPGRDGVVKRQGGGRSHRLGEVGAGVGEPAAQAATAPASSSRGCAGEWPRRGWRRRARRMARRDGAGARGTEDKDEIGGFNAIVAGAGRLGGRMDVCHVRKRPNV